MTASELKYQHESRNPASVFFSRSSMNAFRDTMAGFGVCDGGTVQTWTQGEVAVWQLYRKRRAGVYHFAKDDFRRIHAKREPATA